MKFPIAELARFFRNAIVRSIPIVLIAATLSARAQDFDLSRDFDTNANPSGVWAYGWETTLGETFTPVTFIGRGFADNGMPFDAWSIQQFVLPGFYHYPLSNPQPGITGGGQGIYPPGSFAFHPGAEGTPQNYAVVRFTAPSNGTYHVAAAVRHYLTGNLAGDTELHVLSNGVILLSQFMAVTDTSGYTDIIQLNAGATLDFATGRGADGSLNGSGLVLQLVITPESSPLPFITQQPESVTAKTGERVKFKVVATSPTPVEFQWYFEGELLEGETASTLTIKPVRPRDEGTYSVRASNQAGSVWTAAVLAVRRGHSGTDR